LKPEGGVVTGRFRRFLECSNSVGDAADKASKAEATPASRGTVEADPKSREGREYFAKSLWVVPPLKMNGCGCRWPSSPSRWRRLAAVAAA